MFCKACYQKRYLLSLIAAFLFLNQLSAQSVSKKNNTVVEFDTTGSEEVFYKIDKINRINADSGIATIRFGKKDGLFGGTEGNVMTSHNSGAPTTRESVVYVASAKLLTLTDTSASFAIQLYKKYKEIQLFPGDLLGIQTNIVKNGDANLFYELAKQDIVFLGNSEVEIKSKQSILLNTDKNFEKKLLEEYTKEINKFYDYFLNSTDTLFNNPYKTGPFKDLSMKEVFKITSANDLNSFFHFVKSFPGKYMGGRWKINETYATWVLNLAPQGEKNREWLIPALQQTPMGSLTDFVQKNKYYISYDTLRLWSEKVFDLQNTGEQEDAGLLCDKLISIAKLTGNRKAEYEFYYTHSFLADAKGNKKEAIKDALTAYENEPKNINYTYQLAGLYGKNEEFDKCFKLYNDLLKALPDNLNIKGNYGWYKLTAGLFDEAMPLCKAAYYDQPSSVAFTVNYGHCFLLKGNLDSAKFFYQKTLENLSVPADYTDGPKTDFDLFFKKGWNRKYTAEMAEWMDNEFNEKYLSITKGNQIWNEAKKEYDKKNYRQAGIKWINYIALFNKSKEPPLSSIHNANNWIGFSYLQAKLYDSAAYYYKVALKIAGETLVLLRNKSTNKEDDFLVSDYERLYYLYTSAGNFTEAERYKTMYDVEIQKVTELFANPSLHLIVLNGMGNSNKQNEVSANNFYSNFIKLKNDNNDPGFLKQLNGNTLTREKLVNNLDEVRKKSKPEDIFVFYYAGDLVNDNNQSYLNFNEKDTAQGRISVTEFMDNLDRVYASKKMIITDQPASSFLSLITSRYSATGKNSPEIIFLCPGIETPVQENGISLFTNQLIASVNDLQKNEAFSAKDFADKASFTLGRGKYYFPVLSFSFGKDFLLYENKMAVVKKNEPANGISRGLELRSSGNNESDVASGPQKNYALLIATDLYKDRGFNKLANPIYDAESMGKLLKEEFDYDVTILKNPTLEQLENKLSSLYDQHFGPNDQLFVFFASHGLYHEKSKMGYLVATDSKVDDPNFKTYLSYSDLGNKYLKNINCNRIFLVLDACFAGSFFDNNIVRGTPQEVDAKNLAALYRTASNQHFYKGISSGAKQYVEDGKQGQHSPFAGSFMNILWNKALNKTFVTADEIIGEIKSNPPGATAVCEGKFQFSDPFSHFIFELKSDQKKSDIKKSDAVSPIGIK